MSENGHPYMRTADIRIILTSIAFLIFTTACRQIDNRIEHGPEVTLIHYLDASYRFDIEEAYKHISSKDKAVRPFDEYKKLMISFGSEHAKRVARRISFEIQKVNAQDSSAEVFIKISTSDFLSKLGDLLAWAVALLPGRKDRKPLEKSTEELFENEKMPLIDPIKKFILLKERDGWKVRLNWKEERKEQKS